MSSRPPRVRDADDRASGVPCVDCGREVRLGERIALCQDCGSVHHETCWNLGGGCRSYDCSSGTSVRRGSGEAALRITDDELAAAVPLRPATAFQTSEAPGDSTGDRRRRWNRVAVWAFVIALLGIPLFGLVTGVVAIILGCVALVLHAANRRGLGLAVTAVVIGLFDVLGWAAGMHFFFGGDPVAVSLEDFTVDLESLDALPDHIDRAMRANVLIQSQAGFGLQGMGFGSGVILKIDDGAALVVTNRHVVDLDYQDAEHAQPASESIGGTVIVKALGQAETIGTVEWVAPHGVDLAIVSTAITSRDAGEASWRSDVKPVIGDEVFAVGNPHGLGWTHTAGDVSQLRRQSSGTFNYRVIQTSAAINSGNSGGGLYDASGLLLGINTWTQDKRFAEGLGFSIEFATLLDLIPERFQLPPNNLDDEPQ